MDNSKKVKINISRYNKYLDNTVIILTFLTIILVAIAIYTWAYYVPNVKNISLDLQYTDLRDPSKIEIPSTTGDSLNDEDVSNSNLQTSKALSNVRKPNDPISNFQPAGLRQFCSLTDTSNSLNIPGGFAYPQCAPGLVCTANILTEGPICLADIGSTCNNLNDCVPEADICVNEICTVQSIENKINTPCQSNADCQLNLFEDQINNHLCYKLPGETTGFCKVNIFPFDGGCKSDNDCPQPIATRNNNVSKVIRCVNEDNFSQVLMPGKIICSTGDNCQDGIGLSVQLDQDLNLNYLVDSSQNFMLTVILEGNNVTDVGEQIPFVVEGVCNTENKIVLAPLEFFSGYSAIATTGASVYFGDYPGYTNLIQNKKYGICLELLPLGSPADYKIANVNIPPTDLVENTVIEDIFFKANRNAPGALQELCLNNAEAGSVLSCGETTYLNRKWQMSCGYNYDIEEIILDNIYYGLSPGAFNLKNLGNCMIKTRFKGQLCDNATRGCVDPLVCLPISLPGETAINNYCVEPFRSQVCENNICPKGYTCGSDNFCKSDNDNLAYLASDCLSGSMNNIYLYFYNLDTNRYQRLNLNLEEFLGDESLSNLVVKLGKEYVTVNEYADLGITSKTRLPQRILIYNNISFRVYILEFISGRGYINANNFNLNPSSNSSIHSIELVEDNIAVIQKRTTPEFREIAFKVLSIISSGDNYYIIINNIDEYSNWYPFNILRNNEPYSAYLYSSSDSSFNTKGNGTIKLAQEINGVYRDYLEVQIPDWPGIKTYPSGEDLFIVFNTNKFAFNNAVYMSSVNFGESVRNGLIGGGVGVPLIQIPRNFNNSITNLEALGENFFILPKIYRNNNAVLTPDFVFNNYTPLENGDGLNFDEDFEFFNIKRFQEADNNAVQTISQGATLYPEKIQSYYYFQGSDTKPTNLPLTILNLHSDYLSSEGAVPTFPTARGKQSFTNQNFFKNSKDTLNTDGTGISSPVNFTVYKDMVNYNINFIEVNNIFLEFPNIPTIDLEDSPTFIGVSRNDGTSLIITNGLNNSFTYNFESETDVSFDFYSENSKNYILVKSTVQGTSNYHNYVQKIEYNLVIDDNVFNASDEYDYFYRNGRGENFSFKYLNNVIAPKPKNFYFDSNVNVNSIDTVTENLYDSDTNTFSLFSTFNNDTFIQETGAVEDDTLDINNTNIYSNKAPPLASYSRLNDFEVIKEGSELNVKYNGLNFLNSQEFNFLEIEKGISRTFSTTDDCLNTSDNLGINFITLRTPELIDLFLSNPSSEIVLQKDGDTLEEFYVTTGVSSITRGAIYASDNFKLKDGTTNPEREQDNNWFGNKNLLDFTPTYNNNLENIFKNNNIQINRSVVEISEYDVFIDTNNKVSEYMVIKLNASIDVNDNYVDNIFKNSSKWKIWHNNFVPLSYHNSYNFVAYSNSNNIEVIEPQDDDQNLITIMDGSPLWSGTKGSDFQFADGYNKSSFNKLLFYQESSDNFDVLNAHDGYFYKTEDIFSNFESSGAFDLTTVSQGDNFNAISEYIENMIFYGFAGTTVISPPGNQSGIVANLQTSDPDTTDATALLGIHATDNATILSVPDNESDNILKPIKWNTATYFQKGNIVNNLNFYNDQELDKRLPKKVRLFDIDTTLNFTQLQLISAGVSGKATIQPDYLQTRFRQQNFSNKEFLYFKKKYIRKLPLADYNGYGVQSLDFSTIFYDKMPLNILSYYGNNHSDKINIIDNYTDFYAFDPFDASQSVTNINTSVSPNSFITKQPRYINSLKPIIFENTYLFSPGEYITQISYKVNGYHEVMAYAFYDGSKISNFNFIGNLEMRPVNSASLCLPDKYQNYDQKLYMINNLFLSSLPKVNPSFNYLGSPIINEFIISNIYYDSENNKKYKGLGEIKFKIDASAIFSNNKDVANDYNLINYETVKFPENFTERFVNRVNAIPKIKRVFTSIREGNIYEKLNFYVYLSYSTIEDSTTENANDGFIYMSTNEDLETILENRGVAYTESLAKGEIPLNILSNIVAFEPYNKFLVTLGYSCS